jgi:uroporphyrinogen III methyltransferase/synthase
MSRVVVTRAAHQAEELAAPLRANGFTVLLAPMIGIAPPANPEPLFRAAQNCNAYDWIVFTSANAVNAFAALGGEITASVATVGAATRKAAEQQGWRVALTPENYVAESLIEAFANYDLANCRILIPAAAVTRDVVPSALRVRGAQVDVVEAYRNVAPEDAGARAKEIFRDPYPDWVTFASGSAVENLLAILGPKPLAQVRIASIGPSTSQVIRKHGLMVAIEPDEHTTRGLVRALTQATSSTYVALN